jgi:hypothetical protein
MQLHNVEAELRSAAHAVFEIEQSGAPEARALAQAVREIAEAVEGLVRQLQDAIP